MKRLFGHNRLATVSRTVCVRACVRARVYVCVCVCVCVRVCACPAWLEYARNSEQMPRPIGAVRHSAVPPSSVAEQHLPPQCDSLGLEVRVPSVAASVVTLLRAIVRPFTVSAYDAFPVIHLLEILNLYRIGIPYYFEVGPFFFTEYLYTHSTS